MSSREEYLGSVCREVHFHAARRYVRQELSDHIDDKRTYLEQTGAADAEAEAVNAMGDPVQTGRALNAIHRPRMEWGIVACVLALTIVGAALSFIGMFELNIDGSISYYAGFRVEWAILAVGLAAMALLMFADYRWIVRLRYVCFGAGLACIAAFFVYTLLYPRIDFWAPGLLNTGSESTVFNVILGGITLKKIATAVSSVLFVLGTAGLAYSRKRWSAGDMALFLGCIAASSCAVGIFYSQFALMVAVAGLVILLASLARSPLSQAQKWQRAAISIVAVAVPLTLCMLYLSPQPATESRDVFSMLFPGAVIDHASVEYQLFTQPGGTDSAAVSAFKTYGWLLSLVAALVFLFMLALLVHRSLKVEDALGRTLMLGICAIFGVRCLLFILSILGVTGSLTTSGIPFISDGMSLYLFSSLLIGLFLSVWRHSALVSRQEAEAQVA